MTKVWKETATYLLSHPEDDQEITDLIKKLADNSNIKLIVSQLVDDHVGEWWWHVHHGVLAEPLTEPPENRTSYVKFNKQCKEIPIRLKWFTPVKGPLPEGLETMWKKAYPNGIDPSNTNQPRILSLDLEKLHKKEHPNCPWNGETILE